MSAETFVFTQLQSGALPTELSEVFQRTNHQYLTLINRKRDGTYAFWSKNEEYARIDPYLIIGRGECHHTRSLE